MANICEIVYDITAKGFAVLRSSDGSMPLNYRTVLTMVDGVCPVAQYVPYLQVFAPLEEKFEALERQGYLRRVGQVSSLAVEKFHESAQAGLSIAKMPHIDAEHKESGFAPFA